MQTPSIPKATWTDLLTIVVLAVIMSAFVLASLITQQASSKIEMISDQIVSVSAPSIESLAAIRAVALEAQLALSESIRARKPLDGSGVARVEKSLNVLDRAVQEYLSLPILEGERPFWREIESALVRFNDSVRATRDLIQGGNWTKAQEEQSGRVESARVELIDSTLKAIKFHAQKSRTFGSEIREIRRQSIRLEAILFSLCVLLGITGLVLLLRRAHRYRSLVRVYSDFQKVRADELEWFAGRVAHDIRNPLSSARMAAELALRQITDQAPKEYLARTLRGLSRADAITRGLLDYARSGARPDPGARTEPGRIIADFVDGLSAEAKQLAIEIHVETVPPVLVACANGVYLSLIGNLVGNAMRYMGDVKTRQIVVRVTTDGSIVKTEVIDTGPGISSEHFSSLFEPYFQVEPKHNLGGLGLGLATVRQLARGHMGDAGVTSTPGRGSVFWFVLPLAGPSAGKSSPDA